jgi:hypothetical protein
LAASKEPIIGRKSPALGAYGLPAALYAAEAPMGLFCSVALHDRPIGRPARAVGLIKFLDRARRHDRVWFCTGRDIAEHWGRAHPPTA